MTTDANELVTPIHNRMPAILASDAYPAWLGEDAARDVPELLRPYSSDAMHIYRVSTAVNNVKNDGPECIEPVG